MSGANDRVEIQGFLEEQFAFVEEPGALAFAGLLHISHSGEHDLHVIKTGQSKFGNADQMAQTFDMIATRHARGVVGGGAQQYQLVVGRGIDGRPTAVLPFVRVGPTNIMGPQGSLSSEPPTPTGLTQQAQRWGEQITSLSFSGMQGLLSHFQKALDMANAKNEKTEQINNELWIACKSLLLELQKEKHADKMKELMAARMTEFGKHLITLAPAIVNMMADREVFPLSTADTAILDFIASVSSPNDVAMMQQALMAKGEGGKEIAVTLADRFQNYHKRKAEEAASDKRLMDGLPTRSYEEAELDAAGEAMRALRGRNKSDGALPASPTDAAVKALTQHGVSHSEKQSNGTQQETTTPRAGFGTAEHFLADLFEKVAPEKIDMVIGVLAMEQPELAATMKEMAAHFKS